MTPLEVIGIFAGIPLALFTLIVLLVLAPSLVRGAGRPSGLDWHGQPEWFGARPAPAATSQTGDQSGEEAAGSARGDADSGDTDRGGAGGRW
jgi:hypothetical protein